MSVVIPAYNEAKRIAPTLRSILAYFKSTKIGYEIIVVDDGSTDRTSYTVKQLNSLIKVIRHEQNHGKGDAVKTGVLASQGQYILMIDADGSVHIDELKKLWPHREKSDIVIGSRFLQGSRFGTQHFGRMVVSKIGNLIFKTLFNISVTDSQCGFKLFKTKTVRPIFELLKENGFLFDMELLALANKNGLKIMEVPINWQDAHGSKVRAATAAFASVWQLVKIYLRTR